MAELKTGDTIETAEAVLLMENLPPGKHVFELRVADEAGNLSRPARVAIQVNLVGPRITSFDPGFAFPGEKVIVWVTGLTPEQEKNEVFFQGVRANVVGGSSRTLHATVPARARTGPVSVVNGAGQGVSDQPFFIPERLRLAAPGSVDLAFLPGSTGGIGLIALLTGSGSREAVRCALWNLPARLPSEKAPKPLTETGMAELSAPASRLAVTSTREGDFAIAWAPDQSLASQLFWDGGDGLKVSSLPLPGRVVDMAGGSSGIVGLFQGEGQDQWLTIITGTGEGEMRRAKVPEPLLSLYGMPTSKTVCALSATGQVHCFSLPNLELMESGETQEDATLKSASASGDGGVWAFSQTPARAVVIHGKTTRALALGFTPVALAAHPTGHHAFFAGENQSRILAVHLPDNGAEGLLAARVLNLPFPTTGPASLVLSGSGDDLLVLQAKNRSASFFNARTFRLGLTLPLLESPRQAVSSAEGALFAIAGNTTIEVVSGVSARA